MNPSTLRYFVVDAFAERAFAGNPAAVVPLDQWKEDQWLQNVAMEMNLSETAFLVPNANGFDLRWFTPAAEVDLCGHATLAAAVVLAELGKLADKETVKFSSRSGFLVVERRGGLYVLDFPALPAEPAQPPSGLLESLNVEARNVARSRFDYLIEVESDAAVRNVAPNFDRLAAVKSRGIVITARSDNAQFDFVSRFFAPAVGVNEDPVTGSAHCILAPYWAAKLGKTKMTGYQASRRGGSVHVELRGNRALLGGHAVVFSSGTILA